MLDNTLLWLQNNPGSALWVVPALACLETLVGVGLFVSGAILLSVCTFLYNQQIATIAQMLPLAFVGALVGDQSGFWLGRRLGPGFHRTAFAERHRDKIARTEALIDRYGWGAILFGRLMTAIRSIVPLITGISGYHPLRYVLFDLLAVSIWTLGLWGLIIGVDTLFSM